VVVRATISRSGGVGKGFMREDNAAMSSDRDVIVVGGEALYDLVLDGSDALRAHPGGGPFNTARTIGRLDQPAAYLGRLSRDRFGTRLERMLADDGVALGAVVHTDDPTTLALAELDAAGSAEYRFYERGTSVPGLTPAAALEALPARIAVLHVGSLGLVFEPVATALEAVVEERGADALVVVDPNCRPSVIPDAEAYRRRLHRLLARTHVVKLSQEDLAVLEPERPPAEAARALLERGPDAVLLTLGADGALVVTAGGRTQVAAPAVAVVDTIGAGDAFGGGFVAWWRARGLHRAALADHDAVVDGARFACLVAARTCERPGASPPRLSDL
jgi:fructokinase